MSIKRIMAVISIYLLACGGWVILGTTTALRSDEYFARLGSQVEDLWGTPLVQKAPTLSVSIPGTEQVRWMMPEKSALKVVLQADHRKKGLIWYPTYACEFDGAYTITNGDQVAQKIRLHFDFPAKDETYDKFSMFLDEAPLQVPVDTAEGISEIIELEAGAQRTFHVTYRARGLREWRYQPDRNAGRVRNLELDVTTNFRAVDYAEGSLSPMKTDADGDGMRLTWQADDLITHEDIGIVIPEKLNPGPVTSRITFFAPVCLLFFFLLVASINILYRVDIHPMHYLFVAAGFFAFHLLLSYMVGLLDIHVSFLIAAATSVVMVTSYLSAALRGQLPWKVAAAGQIFFLVLFSYSFFLPGVTGLTVAIGSVVTLGVLMRVTAHVDWSDVFGRRSTSAVSPALPPPIPSEG
jgi:inner membrane protein involved in colicin E2 resistance